MSKPITDKELKQWKEIITDIHDIRKEYPLAVARGESQQSVMDNEKMARLRLTYCAEKAIPRLIAEVERLRAALAEYHHPASQIYRKPYIEEPADDN